MLKSPRVTSTAFAAPALGTVSCVPCKTDCGNDVQSGMQQSHKLIVLHASITGSTACTLHAGFVYCGASGQSVASETGFEANTFTFPSEP